MVSTRGSGSASTFHNGSSVDWYDNRHLLNSGQVFRTADGVVMLDRRVAGDGTDWIVADWWNGWAYMDARVHPSDLIERLPDNYNGEAAQ